jgi:hypothetical protein
MKAFFDIPLSLADGGLRRYKKTSFPGNITGTAAA